jgi:hypothetical protein
MCFMGSGSNGPSGLDTSASSLEIALDQAIAQRFQSAQDRASRKRRNSPAPISTALAVSAKETALALFPPRLYWRGIAVSEEFQAYAARVALGEQLAPYRGEVLSHHCPSFPWSKSTALATSTAPTPTLPKYPERGRSLKTTLCLVASVGSLMAAMGFGAGAASVDASDDELPEFRPSQVTAALMPARAPARSAEGLEPLASGAELAGPVPPPRANADQHEPIATLVTRAPRALAPSSNLPRPTVARAPLPGAARVGGPVPSGAAATKASGAMPTSAGAASASGVAAGAGSSAGAPAALGIGVRAPYAAAPAYSATTPYASTTAYAATAPTHSSTPWLGSAAGPVVLPGASRSPAAPLSAAPFAGAAPLVGESSASTLVGAPRVPETPSRDTALFSDQPSF